MMATKSTIDPIVVAVDSGVLTAPDGSEFTVRMGQRFRASDRVVELWPRMFLDWATTTDDDLTKAREALIQR